MFFGEALDIPTHKQHQQARLICYNCPVQVQCLADCVARDIRFGVWGGLTESQRKRYLRPALQENGKSEATLIRVIDECGVQLLKRHETNSNSNPMVSNRENGN